MPLASALPAPERTAKVLRSPCRLETEWFSTHSPNGSFAPGAVDREYQRDANSLTKRDGRRRAGETAAADEPLQAELQLRRLPRSGNLLFYNRGTWIQPESPNRGTDHEETSCNNEWRLP
jgi:hypothetical protein